MKNVESSLRRHFKKKEPEKKGKPINPGDLNFFYWNV
jgi:hypothetical protein